MLIHRIAAQLYTAEALQAVEAGLDAGEDVTLAVSQSAARLWRPPSLRAVRARRSIS